MEVSWWGDSGDAKFKKFSYPGGDSDVGTTYYNPHTPVKNQILHLTFRQPMIRTQRGHDTLTLWS